MSEPRSRFPKGTGQPKADGRGGIPSPGWHNTHIRKPVEGGRPTIVSKPGTTTPWVDPDDASELTEAWFAKAELHEGEKPVNRGGRPRGSDKEQIALRVDKDVLARFRAMGA